MALRILKTKVYGPDDEWNISTYIYGYCNSNDVKPKKSIAEGSTLVETDTDWLYVFEEDKGDWTQKYKVNGGSGSGSDYRVSATDPEYDGNVAVE